MNEQQRTAALRLASVPICDRSIGWQSDATILLLELASEPVQEPDPVIQRESRGWSAADESMKDEV